MFNVDPEKQPVSYGGPINIITLASTGKDYMWGVGTDRVSYIYSGDGQWTTLTSFQALADASDNVLSAIPDDSLRAFGESSAARMDAASMDNYLKSLFGENYAARFGNGTYSVVDKDNVLYANFGKNLYAFELINPDLPYAGIKIRHVLKDIIVKVQGGDPAPPSGTRISSVSMTYDGYVIVGFTNGVAVINRDLNVDSASFYRFGDDEYVSNSLSVDENNGIYVASNKLMRKLVWTGATLSDNESAGAWSCPYDTATELPPIIKFDNGTGSTPTLMGFGGNSDKLVVITDGAKQMKLVAFWRDTIPNGFVQKPGTASRRIAGQIQVTCGFSPLPEWIQSEQSVVVHGYGAFVVNNIPQTVNSDIVNKNKILQVSLMGPAYDSSYGVERFEWDPAADGWYSVWTRSDVSSTSMIPVYSKSGDMALINGYMSNGWEVTGLDWDTGEIVHRTIFGDQNFGNGAYAILQYLKDGDLLFNSIAGPLRVHYGK
ncbi:MAG: hypothetical protein M0Z56_02620 [Desulfobacteraceae bacterium]|nr:hypothetical protein [Desulfobacteraceae bacterium]